MNDDLQRIWKSQGEITLDAAALAETLRRHDQTFGRMIYLRDVREIGVALVLIPIWIGMGIGTSSPWTWYLEIPALAWIAGYMCVDRLRQRRAAPAAGASLRTGIEHSLSQVEHQIWLLRNVHWWYLMPMAIPMFLFFGQVAGRTSDGFSWESIPVTLGPVATVIGVFGFVYWLNQYAVRKQLEPLRERLEAVLATLLDAEAPAT